MTLRRALALCLAAVLCWSSLSTQESWLDVIASADPACPSRPGPDGHDAAPAGLPSGGSVGDHHLDDQPGQPTDAAADQPVLPVRAAGVETHEPARLAPAWPAGKRHAAPSLDGPMRPPRATRPLA
ncbi:MAG: hypothetical protein IPM15_15605 [Betaproteobacteria bacterium]|nr:hypothetical protein [Betaproteobacteria bacterium]MCC6248961.1 hypothetical protein [Rubrivivax sp.]